MHNGYVVQIAVLSSHGETNRSQSTAENPALPMTATNSAELLDLATKERMNWKRRVRGVTQRNENPLRDSA